MLKKLILAVALTVSATAIAHADAHSKCGIETGRINILGNEFPAIQTIAKAAEECAVDGKVEIKTNLTTEHKDIQVAALKASPSEYTAAIVANSSIVPLLNDGLIRPLDDLIAEFGQDIPKSQLITIDGKVYAVAFMANAQHLMFRKDILEKAGVEPPKTYEDVLAAAKAIKDAGLMDYPISGTYQTGWNLAEEFVNMYFGLGGSFFKDGTAEPAINNEKGVQAINMMKALSEYMNPDFLTYDSNAASAEWEAGNVAMMNMWGSRASAITDAEGSTEEITSNTVMAAAPTVGGGSMPASTLWWDGFTIAANISDEDAEATFRALVHGIDPSVITAENNDEAVWLISSFKPGPLAQGVAATASAGTAPYPMQPYMAAMHTALGNELSDVLQGNESAEQALADVEAAYTTSAKEAGFLQ